METEGGSVIREFNCYREILAIYPKLLCTGWAVFSDKSGTLLACGVARPFTQVSQTLAIAELRSKLLNIWEDRVGFSKNPKILAVEMLQDSQQTTASTEANETIPLSMMSGLLWASFKANQVLFPKPTSWKRHLPLDGINEHIVARLNLKGKQVLAEGLHVVPRHLRYTVYNAVGIGQWAFRQTQKGGK
jgi:hypothetical protein